MKMVGSMDCFVQSEGMPAQMKTDQSAAIAQCGIARTKDMVNWERLNDLITTSPQQRNVVLHPEFVEWQICLLYPATG